MCVFVSLTWSGVNKSVLIRLFAQQERSSVNALAPVYPHLYSNQVIFIKMLLPTRQGGGGTMGNAWVTFSFPLLLRELTQFF